MVRILAGGEAMRLSLPNGGSRRASERTTIGDKAEIRGKGRESDLCLAQAAKWSGQEAREWRAVETLIVAFKRRTPRVRRGASTCPVFSSSFP
jgi:hypothetical protein